MVYACFTLNVIERIVDGFILTVGITPPSSRTRRLATIFIASAMALAVLLVLAIFVLLLTHLSNH